MPPHVAESSYESFGELILPPKAHLYILHNKDFMRCAGFLWCSAPGPARL